MLLQEEDGKKKKKKKRKKKKYKFEDESESDSEDDFDDWTFRELCRVMDNQLVQAVSLFDHEISKYSHQHVKTLKKNLGRDLDYLKQDLLDEKFLENVQLEEESVQGLEERLRRLEARKREATQRRNYYQARLNKMKRKGGGGSNQFALPAHKIVQQTDVVGGLRKCFSEPNLHLLDGNLSLLNERGSRESFISNILFVQEYIVERGFLSSNLGRSIKDDKEYFFNKFEKTISSSLEYNFFTANSNHFSIDYNKFKNKGNFLFSRREKILIYKLIFWVVKMFHYKNNHDFLKI